MYRARSCLTNGTLKNLYYSYIYPYLIYCIEIWGIPSQTHLNPLLFKPKKFVRIMTFSFYYAHTAPIFRDLEILTIDQLIVHRIGTIMYTFNYGLLPDVLNSMYRKICKIHSYNTRSKYVFRISSGTQTFSNISARIWNSLLVNLDIDVSLIKFKESLKQYLLNNVLNIKYTK